MENKFERASFVIFGAGKNARNIIRMLPYGMVAYFVDSDAQKWGKLIWGISIEAPQKLYRDANKKVVCSFKDELIEKKLKEEKIDFFYLYDKGKNYFFSKEYSDYLDIELVSQFYNCFDVLQNIKGVSIVNHWRSSFLSRKNEELVKAMKASNEEQVNQILGVIYADNKLYFDEKYKTRPGMRLVRNIIVDKKLTKVCDLACGHGELIKKLKEDGIEVLGVESSIERVEALRRDNINVINEDVDDLEVCEENFDAIICMECMEHIKNPQKLVRNIYNMLKLGGYVFVTVPYLYNCESDAHVRHFDENQLYTYFADLFVVENIMKIPYLNNEYQNNIFLAARKSNKESSNAEVV